ncbi:MAG: sugar ABC transporter substrate-binding protein [Chloroflexota bacterium]|nr:MAG: sugar ABC transporter substrate-binding protein [Chloroflexota bacterium]
METRTRKSNFLWVLLSLFVIATMMISCVRQPATETAAPPAAGPTEAVEPTEPEAQPTEAEVTDDEDFSPDIPDPEEPVTISFASWVHSGNENDIWEILAARFHEIHPNITITFQDVPFEEMHDKLLTQIASNNPPDTAYVDSPIVGEFSQRNALVALDDYVSKSTVVDITDYVPAFLTAAQNEGQLFGLPIDGESTGLFYRMDRFEEAGLDPNHPPETWAEFEDYAAKLTDTANNKYGFIAFAPEAAYYFYPWLWQAGGDVLNPDDPNDVIFDNPAGQRAADFYVKLAQYAPADFLNSNSWDGRVAFANGDVAMYVAGAWFAGTLLSEFPDATGLWNTAPLPTDERCATTIASDHLVVFSATKNPEAAYKWIEFVSAPENMAIINLGTPEYPATLLPPRVSLLEDPTLFENREFLQGFADNMQCAIVSEVVQPKFYLVEETLTEYLGRAFYGEFPDGATAVREAAVVAEEALKE